MGNKCVDCGNEHTSGNRSPSVAAPADLCDACYSKHFQSGKTCCVCGVPARKYVQVYYDDGTVAQQYFCVYHNFLNIQQEPVTLPEFRGLDTLIPSHGYVDGEIDTDVAKSYRQKHVFKVLTDTEREALRGVRTEVVKLPDNLEPRGVYGLLTDAMWEKLSEVKAPDMDDEKVYAVPDTEYGLTTYWSKWLVDHTSGEEPTGVYEPVTPVVTLDTLEKALNELQEKADRWEEFVDEVERSNQIGLIKLEPDAKVQLEGGMVIATGALPDDSWSKWMAMVVKDHLEDDDELPHHTCEIGGDVYLPIGEAVIDEVVGRLGLDVSNKEE